MNIETLRSAYMRMLDERGAPEDDGCVEPDALLAVVEATATESDRLSTLGHVGACPRCRAELDLLMTAAQAGRATARTGWHVLTPLRAAAVALLLIGGATLWQATRNPATDTMRADPVDAVRLLAPGPEAAVGTPLTLTWAAVPAARRYEVEILDPAGTAVFAAGTADTTLVIPPGTLEPGARYRWWVRVVALDAIRPSPLRPLRLTPP